MKWLEFKPLWYIASALGGMRNEMIYSLCGPMKDGITIGLQTFKLFSTLMTKCGTGWAQWCVATELLSHTLGGRR